MLWSFIYLVFCGLRCYCCGCFRFLICLEACGGAVFGNCDTYGVVVYVLLVCSWMPVVVLSMGIGDT